MDAIIFPIKLSPAIQRAGIDIITDDPDEIEERTFDQVKLEVNGREQSMREADVEEFVRKNIGLVFPDEDLLIVGRQVINEEKGRSDLVALDGSGRIVLIEIKRDAKSMKARGEPLEFQAIRYAANYAMIKQPDELVNKLFAPYVSKHIEELREPGKSESSAEELAYRKLEDFIEKNKIDSEDFNRGQRIVLIASDFDKQTRSACAWLAKNNVDIRCVALSPFAYKGQYFLAIEDIIPPPSLEEFFVGVSVPIGVSRKSPSRSPRMAKGLPRMRAIFEEGLISPGTKVYINVPTLRGDIAEVIDHLHVKYEGKELTFNEWGMKMTGWSAINVYRWICLEENKKSLDDLRRELDKD